MNVKVKDTENLNDYELKINHSERFWDATYAVNDYLKELPLSVEQNNHLIELLIAHMSAAERDALFQGLSMGIRIAKHEVADED